MNELRCFNIKVSINKKQSVKTSYIRLLLNLDKGVTHLVRVIYNDYLCIEQKLKHMSIEKAFSKFIENVNSLREITHYEDEHGEGVDTKETATNAIKEYENLLNKLNESFNQRIIMGKISLILVSVLLFSCGENNFKNKGRSTWIVDKIENESQTTSTYFARTTDTTDLAEYNTWFTDSVGAFQVGDTLSFTKKVSAKKENKE